VEQNHEFKNHSVVGFCSIFFSLKAHLYVGISTKISARRKIDEETEKKEKKTGTFWNKTNTKLRMLILGKHGESMK